MSDYKTTMAKHRRLTILKFLSESAGYTSNASVLKDVCNGFGVTSTRTEITAELEWLKDEGFVKTEASEHFIVTTATDSGVDVAEGRERHDGIQRPRAGS